MKTDMELKTFVNHIKQLRCYDDDTSNLIKLKMIDELSMQIRNQLINAKLRDCIPKSE